MCDTTGLSPDVHLKCHIVLVFLEDSGSWCKIQLKNNFLKASFPWAFEMTKKKNLEKQEPWSPCMKNTWSSICWRLDEMFGTAKQPQGKAG